MKKIIIIAVICIVFLASMCLATPWLAVDLPPTGFTPTQVQVEVTLGTGSPVINPGVKVISGADYKIYDLAGLAIGDYKFRARWADASGWWSDWSVYFNSTKPGAPVGFRVVP